jgi:hypothetical protein
MPYQRQHHDGLGALPLFASQGKRAAGKDTSSIMNGLNDEDGLAGERGDFHELLSTRAKRQRNAGSPGRCPFDHSSSNTQHDRLKEVRSQERRQREAASATQNIFDNIAHP